MQFAAERFAESAWTQKNRVEALKELSNDVCFDESDDFFHFCFKCSAQSSRWCQEMALLYRAYFLPQNGGEHDIYNLNIDRSIIIYFEKFNEIDFE